MSNTPRNLSSPRLSLSGVSAGLLAIGLLASVLFVAPIFDNAFFISKLAVALILGLGVLIMVALRAFQNRSIEFPITRITGASLVLGGSALASSFLTAPYPYEHLFGFGGVLLAAAIVLVFGSSFLSKAHGEMMLRVYQVGAALLATLGVLQLFQIGPANWLNAAFNLQLPTTVAFTLIGSGLAALAVILTALISMVAEILANKHVSRFQLALLPFLAIGTLLYGWSVLPGNPAATTFPSLAASWSIALDVIRTPKNALVGIGPSAYTNAYIQYKPVWVNGQPNWNIQYGQGFNTPLTYLVSLGFIGLVAWLWLSYQVVRLAREAKSGASRGLATIAVGLLLVNLVIPPNLVLVIMQAIMLAALLATISQMSPLAQLQAFALRIIKPRNDHPFQPTGGSHQLPAIGLSGLLLLAVAFLSYLTGRGLYAHYLSWRSDQSAAANAVVQTYEQRQAAVRANPYYDDFRRRYALTNVLIAGALSNKTDATDADRQQVAQLLQQAVREGRAATELDATDTRNWSTLSQIYQAMMGSVQDANNWATQSLLQAIQTDPTNPDLRITLGGLFMQAKQYSQAVGIFQQAVNIKPDHANSHYNLALAQKAQGDLAAAQTSYQSVLQLLDSSSESYSVATKELEELNKAIAATLSAQPSATTDKSPNATNAAALNNTLLTNQVGNSALENTGNDVQLPTPTP